MSLTVFTPDPDLVDYIDAIWIQEMDSPSHSEQSVGILPGTSTVICVQYRAQVRQESSPDLYRSAITGLQTHTRNYYAVGNIGSVVARFTPWGAAAIFQMNMCELTDLHLHLHDIISPQRVAEMEHRIIETTRPAQKAQALQQFVRDCCRGQIDRLINQVAQMIRDDKGQLPVAAIARRIGMSERQLERRFTTKIGVSPKIFSRIVRFQSALRKQKIGTGGSALAVDSGFFDQSHFIREFKSLAGQSPRDFFQRRESNIARYVNQMTGKPGNSDLVYV